MQKGKTKEDLSCFKDRWAVAELQVVFKPCQSTHVLIKKPQDVYRVFMSMWDKTKINLQEDFVVLFLNKANCVIGYRVIHSGNLQSYLIDYNLIVTSALLCRAENIIIGHNSPSGYLNQSMISKNITEILFKKIKHFDIGLMDHVIISDDSYYSFMENGVFFERELKYNRD